MEKKLANISARIEENVKKVLEDESEIQQISFNSLVNKILKKHVEWERFTKEIGMIYLSKSVFRNILVKLDEKDLKILAASSCRTALRDAVVYIKKDLNYETILQTFDMWLNSSHIPFRRENLNGRIKYLIQHDLGKKYSIYLHTTISSVLSEIECIINNVDLGDSSLVFDVIEPKKTN